MCASHGTLIDAEEKTGAILSPWLGVLIKETGGYFNILLLFEN